MENDIITVVTVPKEVHSSAMYHAVMTNFADTFLHIRVIDNISIRF